MFSGSTWSASPCLKSSHPHTDVSLRDNKSIDTIATCFAPDFNTRIRALRGIRTDVKEAYSPFTAEVSKPTSKGGVISVTAAPANNCMFFSFTFCQWLRNFFQYFFGWSGPKAQILQIR